MADRLGSLAWHVTAGVTRGTRNRVTKVGPALTAGPTNSAWLSSPTPSEATALEKATTTDTGFENGEPVLSVDLEGVACRLGHYWATANPSRL
jgi:hypothetical protein